MAAQSHACKAAVPLAPVYHYLSFSLAMKMCYIWPQILALSFKHFYTAFFFPDCFFIRPVLLIACQCIIGE